MVIAVLGRPAPPPPPATDLPSRSPAAVATVVPTADRNVPAACQADVRGTAFATGPLEERASAVRAWSSANRGRTASLLLTDDVLSESVRASLAAPDAPPFRDATVAIRPEGIRVGGTATAAFLRFPIRATLVPDVRAGVLRFEVRDLETGGLPPAFRGDVEGLISQAADPAAWRVPLRVQAFILRSGCAVLVGDA